MMNDLTIGAASQTYSRAGKMAAPAASNTSTPGSFADILTQKIKEPIQTGYAAERAVGQYHAGTISQQDFTAIMNEAQIQLAEAKSILDLTVKAAKDVLASGIG